MSLLSILFLAASAYAAEEVEFEWYGVVKLAHSSEYTMTIKTLTETMNLYIAEINEGAAIDVGKLDTIVDGAEAFMKTYEARDGTIADGGEIDVGEQTVVTLTMGAGATTTYELHVGAHNHARRLSGDDVYFAIFAGHLDSEWEDSSTHFLKCGASAACGDVAAGTDIELECVGEIDHSGHGHRRLSGDLSGDHEHAAPTCPTPDTDGASKPAVALALAGLAGGLALFL